MSTVRTGIIGGSGLYELGQQPQEVRIQTPYGAPSAPIQISSLGDSHAAFLPRHGKAHEFAPHLINYRANIFAMKSIGVEWLVGLNCAGSLSPEIHPGDIVISDDFINYTIGRPDTFVRPGDLICLGMQHAFSAPLRRRLKEAAERAGLKVHHKATVAVINGPRLSTPSESRRYSRDGCQIVNMTQYPECYLAKELGISYASVTLITDYDSGVAGYQPVQLGEMKECFANNLWKLTEIVSECFSQTDLSADLDFQEEYRNSIVNGTFYGEQANEYKGQPGAH